MADCKCCGAWFSSTAPSELCPTCERALKRLNGYAVPVVRCKNCKHWEEYDGEMFCHCDECAMTYTTPDDYCSYGERKEGE